VRLARVLGGKLPLPEAVLSKYRARMSEAMAQNLPRWQHTASIDSGGTPNASAVAATMGRLAMHVLEHEPADPVLFLPLVDANLRPAQRRGAADRRADRRSHAHRSQSEPMSGAQRAELLKRIREGAPVASAKRSLTGTCCRAAATPARLHDGEHRWVRRRSCAIAHFFRRHKWRFS
jgi:hypothetical protein